jgi:hypothetical protein
MSKPCRRQPDKETDHTGIYIRTRICQRQDMGEIDCVEIVILANGTCHQTGHGLTSAYCMHVEEETIAD